MAGEKKGELERIICFSDNLEKITLLGAPGLPGGMQALTLRRGGEGGSLTLLRHVLAEFSALFISRLHVPLKEIH